MLKRVELYQWPSEILSKFLQPPQNFCPRWTHWTSLWTSWKHLVGPILAIGCRTRSRERRRGGFSIGTPIIYSLKFLRVSYRTFPKKHSLVINQVLSGLFFKISKVFMPAKSPSSSDEDGGLRGHRKLRGFKEENWNNSTCEVVTHEFVFKYIPSLSLELGVPNKIGCILRPNKKEYFLTQCVVKISGTLSRKMVAGIWS